MANERRNEKDAGKEMNDIEKAHYKSQHADMRKKMKKSTDEAKEKKSPENGDFNCK
ncbi:MAG: hypothetical protein V1775_03290 [Bacteroidota bacterium]